MQSNINLLTLYNFMCLSSRTIKMTSYLKFCNIDAGNFSKYLKTNNLQYVSVDKLLRLYEVIRIDCARLAREWL